MTQHGPIEERRSHCHGPGQKANELNFEAARRQNNVGDAGWFIASFSTNAFKQQCRM